jgi:hypothetical protein
LNFVSDSETMIWGFKAADFDHETRTGFASSDNPVSQDLSGLGAESIQNSRQFAGEPYKRGGRIDLAGGAHAIPSAFAQNPLNSVIQGSLHD